MIRPTRFYSTKQEKAVAKAINGKRTPNSGATAFSKGDTYNDRFLIECKTKTTDSKSISIKKEWIEKNKEEAFAMRKDYAALAFSFGDNVNYYIIDEKTFKLFNKLLEDLENNGEKKN